MGKLQSLEQSLHEQKDHDSQQALLSQQLASFHQVHIYNSTVDYGMLYILVEIIIEHDLSSKRVCNGGIFNVAVQNRITTLCRKLLIWQLWRQTTNLFPAKFSGYNIVIMVADVST